MIALLFTAEPKEAEKFLKEVEEYEAKEEAREIQHEQDIRDYINQLSKEELRERLFDMMLENEYYRNNRW